MIVHIWRGWRARKDCEKVKKGVRVKVKGWRVGKSVTECRKFWGHTKGESRTMQGSARCNKRWIQKIITSDTRSTSLYKWREAPPVDRSIPPCAAICNQRQEGERNTIGLTSYIRICIAYVCIRRSFRSNYGVSGVIRKWL